MSGESISLRAHAKVNLSLYVTGRRDDGYHDIVSFMQGVSLFDEVTVTFAGAGQSPDAPAADGFTYQSAPFRMGEYRVTLASDAAEMPYDMRNLALRGAAAVLGPAVETAGADGFGADLPQVRITVRKRLPVAAGIAGGSGNAAAAMLAADHLLGYPYTLRELMTLGAGIGADVPFSLLMNAYYNRGVLADLPGVGEASPAALMRGIGDIVEPAEPLEYEVLMMNPGTGVSTALAYRAIDERPAPDRGPFGLFYNAFEDYTYRTDGEAQRLRAAMERHLHADHTLLSGSGPTTVAYYKCKDAALQDFETALTAGWMDTNWKIWHAHSGGEEV